jgi:hypothetical protein
MGNLMPGVRKVSSSSRVSSSHSCHFRENAERPPLCCDALLCTIPGRRFREAHTAFSTPLVVLEFGQTNILRHPETCRPSFWASIHPLPYNLRRSCFSTVSTARDKSIARYIYFALFQHIFHCLRVSSFVGIAQRADKLEASTEEGSKRRVEKGAKPPIVDSLGNTKRRRNRGGLTDAALY